MPSAGRPFTSGLVTELMARGVLLAPLTLHAGVSSLEYGETPYSERYRVPPATARLVNAVRSWGGRVIAVGTTVVRALETVAAPGGAVAPGHGTTPLVLTPERGFRAIDGLLTGWHEPESSHLELLEAAAGSHLLERSYAAARAHGYRWHEFGDSHLILPDSLRAVVLSDFGPPENLVPSEVPEPVAGPGEALIDIELGADLTVDYRAGLG